MAPRFPEPTRSVMPQITSAPSPMLVWGMAWLTIMAGSILPGWLMATPPPLLPSFGYLLLLGWRQLRPGLLPVWAGLPLGLIDDLFSGQPLGSAIVLWSASMVVLDIVDVRFPWRNFVFDWLIAAVMIASASFAFVLIASPHGGANVSGDDAQVLKAIALGNIALQALLGVLLYPLIVLLVAWADAARLRPLPRWRP